MSAAVERYLGEVESLLPRGCRDRADYLDELRDGLLTAAERRSGGYTDVVAEFGPPKEIAAALGREMHLREARRGAIRLLAVLASMSVLWLAYRTAVGTPSTLVPDGWTRPVFIAGTDIVQIAPNVAMASAALLAVAASIRSPHAWIGVAHRLLAVVALGATALFSLAIAAIAATASAAHRVEVLTVAIPAAALVAGVLWHAARATHHTYRALRTAPS